MVSILSIDQIYLKISDTVLLAVNYHLLRTPNSLCLNLECFPISLCRTLFLKEINIVLKTATIIQPYFKRGNVDESNGEMP